MHAVNPPAPLTPGQIAYREYLQSDHWRDLRLQAFKKWGRKCFKCPATCRLDVHHLIYRHPWTECTVDDVRPCCRDCHDKEHGIVNIIRPDEKRRTQRRSKRKKKKQRAFLASKTRRSRHKTKRQQWNHQMRKESAASNSWWRRRNWSL